MAVRFFIYSINDCSYKAYNFTCKLNCPESMNKFLSESKSMPSAHMGYYADQSTAILKQSYGSFFVKTTSVAPFCNFPKPIHGKANYLFKRLVTHMLRIQ
jgi:hypothetical protein